MISLGIAACQGEGSSKPGAPDAGARAQDAGPQADAGPGVDAGALDAGQTDSGTPDAGASGPQRLLLGQSATGIATSSQPVTYFIALNAGDEVRLSAFAVRGDLQPAAFVSFIDDAFVEPDSYEVGDQQVVLNYLITQTGDHSIVVRPHQDIGEGQFLLRTECIGGTCAAAPVPAPDVTMRLLAINDFHGALEAPSRSAGGAAWLASHLERLREATPHHLLVSAGDLVGASPFLSSRFHDEPSIEVMNMMGLEVASVGNHEFDEGPQELLRLVEGGCHPVDGCQDGTPYNGAEFEVLAANVQTMGGTDLLPGCAIRVFGGVAVGLIGMTLEGTRYVTVPSAVEDLVFEDEVETVNRLIPKLQAMGVEAIIVVVHEGGHQQGGANECTDFGGNIRGIATAVHDAVDVVVSGHTHATYNCVIDDKVVTSAGSSGRWITAVDLDLDGSTGQAQAGDVENHRVDHTLAPNQAVADVVTRYRELVDAEEGAVVGTLASGLARSTDGSGQSDLGFVIADSQLHATEGAAGAQIAFMNRGGIRADLAGGAITYGQAFAVQPFGNDLVTMTLTGQQLKDLLDGQFSFGNFTVLQPSASLRYQIEPISPGATAVRIVADSITILGLPLDLGAEYRVTVNGFIAEGGDGHRTFIEGTDRVIGVVDVDAFVNYLSASPSPLPVPVMDRITFR